MPAFQIDAFQNNAFQMASVVVTSTNRLQKPVDYALAGDQDYPEGKSSKFAPVRAGRLSRRMVRHTFNE